MLAKLPLYLKHFDWVLFIAALLLVIFGLVEIYSVALGQGQVDLLNFKKQIIFAAIGIAVLFFFAFFDYQNWRSYSLYLFFTAVLLLVGLFFFGSTIRGTRGWYFLGPLSVQPVEAVKAVLLIFLARYFSRLSQADDFFRHFIVTGAASLALVLLVAGQPDFGSAFILAALWLIMLVIRGFPKKYILAVFMILAAVGVLGWLFVFADYQKERIMVFLHPSSDPLAGGYNITQAIIAVGAGRYLGRGIGFGSQSQLKFLPEAQNDFIFAVIAEELGFFGVLLVLGLFATVFYRLVKGARAANDNFSLLFLLGAMGLIFIQMFINIGMNVGLLPVVGLSLPFVSYGGSSLLVSLALMGIAQNIIIQNKIRY